MRWEKFLRKRFTLENGSAERKKKVASLLTRLLEEAKVLADVPSVINSEKWCTNVQLVLELDVLYQRNAGYSEEVTAHMWRYYKATKDGTEASQKALEAAVGAAVRISSTHVMATPKAPEGEKPTTPGESATARPPAARGKKPHPKLLGELAPQQRFKSGGVVPTGLGPDVSARCQGREVRLEELQRPEVRAELRRQAVALRDVSAKHQDTRDRLDEEWKVSGGDTIATLMMWRTNLAPHHGTDVRPRPPSEGIRRTNGGSTDQGAATRGRELCCRSSAPSNSTGPCDIIYITTTYI
eukprot:PhM_4_TR3441/c1_g1_i5/m.21955